jgi:ABC-type multidrug transport system ATPase subunit
MNKKISGGQRKRLNCGLELIREPSVLFVDEPTSGLSSRDSENIMDLLKELALKGKLIFVVIHQPSSEIFKMFDKLMITDTGGYPIYHGNPLDAIVYFKTAVQAINQSESECTRCGNVNPEQIFNIIEGEGVV